MNANLINSPRFSALSYVWGDSKDLLPILVHGRRYHVTKNYFAALWRLRRLEIGSQFWIDAICTYQQDDVEKATQVPLMGQIYSTSENVLVWLGYSDDIAKPDLVSRDLATVASLSTISELTGTLQVQILRQTTSSSS